MNVFEKFETEETVVNVESNAENKEVTEKRNLVKTTMILLGCIVSLTIAIDAVF